MKKEQRQSKNVRDQTAARNAFNVVRNFVQDHYPDLYTQNIKRELSPEQVRNFEALTGKTISQFRADLNKDVKGTVFYGSNKQHPGNRYVPPGIMSSRVRFGPPPGTPKNYDYFRRDIDQAPEIPAYSEYYRSSDDPLKLRDMRKKDIISLDDVLGQSATNAPPTFSPIIDQQPLNWMDTRGQKGPGIRQAAATVSPVPSAAALMRPGNEISGKRQDDYLGANISAKDRMNVALTIAGEIDPRLSPYGQPETTQEIANILETITTRADLGGKSLTNIVKQHNAGNIFQYSTWNKDKTGQATAAYAKHGKAIDAAVEGYFNGTIQPTVKGLTNYHAYYMEPKSGWNKRMDFAGRTGAHKFYIDKNYKNQALPNLSANPVGTVTSKDLKPPPGFSPQIATAPSAPPQQQIQPQQSYSRQPRARPETVPGERVAGGFQDATSRDSDIDAKIAELKAKIAETATSYLKQGVNVDASLKALEKVGVLDNGQPSPLVDSKGNAIAAGATANIDPTIGSEVGNLTLREDPRLTMTPQGFGSAPSVAQEAQKQLNMPPAGIETFGGQPGVAAPGVLEANKTLNTTPEGLADNARREAENRQKIADLKERIAETATNYLQRGVSVDASIKALEKVGVLDVTPQLRDSRGNPISTNANENINPSVSSEVGPLQLREDPRLTTTPQGFKASGAQNVAQDALKQLNMTPAGVASLSGAPGVDPMADLAAKQPLSPGARISELAATATADQSPIDAAITEALRPLSGGMTTIEKGTTQAPDPVFSAAAGQEIPIDQRISELGATAATDPGPPSAAEARLNELLGIVPRVQATTNEPPQVAVDAGKIQLGAPGVVGTIDAGPNPTAEMAANQQLSPGARLSEMAATANNDAQQVPSAAEIKLNELLGMPSSVLALPNESQPGVSDAGKIQLGAPGAFGGTADAGANPTAEMAANQQLSPGARISELAAVANYDAQQPPVAADIKLNELIGNMPSVQATLNGPPSASSIAGPLSMSDARILGGFDAVSNQPPPASSSGVIQLNQPAVLTGATTTSANPSVAANADPIQSYIDNAFSAAGTDGSNITPDSTAVVKKAMEHGIFGDSSDFGASFPLSRQASQMSIDMGPVDTKMTALAADAQGALSNAHEAANAQKPIYASNDPQIHVIQPQVTSPPTMDLSMGGNFGPAGAMVAPPVPEGLTPYSATSSHVVNTTAIPGAPLSLPSSLGYDPGIHTVLPSNIPLQDDRSSRIANPGMQLAPPSVTAPPPVSTVPGRIAASGDIQSVMAGLEREGLVSPSPDRRTGTVPFGPPMPAIQPVQPPAIQPVQPPAVQFGPPIPDVIAPPVVEPVLTPPAAPTLKPKPASVAPPVTQPTIFDAGKSVIKSIIKEAQASVPALVQRAAKAHTPEGFWSLIGSGNLSAAQMHAAQQMAAQLYGGGTGFGSMSPGGMFGGGGGGTYQGGTYGGFGGSHIGEGVGGAFRNR